VISVKITLTSSEILLFKLTFTLPIEGIGYTVNLFLTVLITLILSFILSDYLLKDKLKKHVRHNKETYEN
jgi:hypothetical protein